ncbi:rad51 family DNA repair protein [Paecilomyces variotii No. 5]|uniref:Rad51 family DNA repair protein n=1 Tax=Byssochlamys spectabilis (strain No. 5 / NBRC 109023) TaxID=1356009 RepID=V5I340_BYSSN|nr:rad51 family DNA repair protein [Paecilomyces variotii No. 5]
MADSFGERLLAEVREETLDEILRDLETFLPAQGDRNQSFFGIKELDELLGLFLSPPAPAPTAIEISRTQVPESTSAGYGLGHTSDSAAYAADYEEENLDGHGMDLHVPVPTPRPTASLKRRQPVVELTSASSAAGKTQLLYYLTAVAVLPSTYHGKYLGGHGAAVVYLDTDGRFDASRLGHVASGFVQQKLKASLPNPAVLSSKETEKVEEENVDPRDIAELVHNALQHIHVFRPQSSSSLLATLRHLDSYLLDVSRHPSATRPLHAIFLDSASAFFWQDRLRDEVARTEEIGRPAAEIERDREQERTFHIAVLYRRLVAELRRLQTIFDCAVVYTTWGLSRAKSTSDYGPTSSYAGFRPHLPPPWGTFPSLRLVVQREPTRPFPPETTLQEAERDAPLRQEVVARGKFWAWVDTWGREEWPRRIVEGLERRNRGRFAFWVRDDVVIGEDGDHP